MFLKQKHNNVSITLKEAECRKQSLFNKPVLAKFKLGSCRSLTLTQLKTVI